MPLLTENVFGASDTRDLISMVTFTFTMRRHLTWLASAPFISSISQRLVGFGFRVQRVGSTMQNLRRVGENSDPILSRLWTNVHKICRWCRKPLVLSNALFQLSVTRFNQKIFAMKSQICRKTEQMQKFVGPQFLWKGRLWLFRGSLLGWLTWQSLVEFCLLMSICEAWQWSRMQNLRRVGKNYCPLWSRLWTKVHAILRRCSRPLVVCNALDRLSISCFFPEI